MYVILIELNLKFRIPHLPLSYNYLHNALYCIILCYLIFDSILLYYILDRSTIHPEGDGGDDGGGGISFQAS